MVAAVGGGRAYLSLQDRDRTQATTEKLESRSAAPGSSGRGGAASEGPGPRGEACLPSIAAVSHPAVAPQVEEAAGRHRPPLRRPAAHCRRERRAARAAQRPGLRLAGPQLEASRATEGPALRTETAVATGVGAPFEREVGQPPG